MPPFVPRDAVVDATLVLVVGATSEWLAEDTVHAVGSAVTRRLETLELKPLPSWIRGAVEFLRARGKGAELDAALPPFDWDDLLADEPLPKLREKVGLALRARAYEDGGAPLWESVIDGLFRFVTLPADLDENAIFGARAAALGEAELLVGRMLHAYARLPWRVRGRRDLIDYQTFIVAVRSERPDSDDLTQDVVDAWIAVSRESASRRALCARWERHIARMKHGRSLGWRPRRSSNPQRDDSESATGVGLAGPVLVELPTESRLTHDERGWVGGDDAGEASPYILAGRTAGQVRTHLAAAAAMIEPALRALLDHRLYALANAAREAVAKKKCSLDPEPLPRWVCASIASAREMAIAGCQVGLPEMLRELDRRLAPDSYDDLVASVPFAASRQPLEVALRWRALLRERREPTAEALREVFGADVPDEMVPLKLGAAELQLMTYLAAERPRRRAGRPTTLDTELFLSALHLQSGGRELEVHEVHDAWCAATGEPSSEKVRSLCRRMLREFDAARAARELEAALAQEAAEARA